MTEDQQIQAAIDQQFKEYQDSNSPAESAAPASAQANPYAALSEASASHATTAEKNKSSIPGVETADSVYRQMPEDVKPLAIGAAGYAGGKMLRSVLPQELVYGTPEYRAAEAAQLNATKAGEQHRIQSDAFKAQHGSAHQEHAANLANLEKAHAQHAFAQTLNVDDELARRSATALPPPGGAAPLTPQARGGEGTANYAEKFGATPAEARKVSSMSAMQQENIPAQQKAWGTISNIAPGFESVKESPLILGPEGQQATRERLNQQQAVGTAAAEEAERARRQMASDIARHKAETQFKLEKAREAAAQSQKSVATAAKDLSAHTAAPPAAPAPSPTGALRALTKLGKWGAPRFVPMAGAAFAPIEAMAAKKAYEEGRYGRAALHGLGTVGALAQATGFPPAMGAGDIATAAALGGGALYDAFNQKTGQ
jgi:hypothetical protein